MKPHFQNLMAMSRDWLARDVFPFWSVQGVDPKDLSFYETLNREGTPVAVPKRAMVQARQIYSFVEGFRMGLLSKEEVTKILKPAADFFVKSYAQPNGGFVHAVNLDGTIADSKMDLYAQAFGLFGLAAAYEVLQEARFKETAKNLLSYLKRERAFKNGGYSEIVNGKIGHEANPHMHLFEAAIAWMRLDSDPLWAEFAAELAKICRDKFFDSKVEALSEHFDPDWRPLNEGARFIWEPGHHYEWAWLFVQYAEVSKTKMDQIPVKLFRKSEDQGRAPGTGFAYDEVWSDGEVKKNSSRFWPQSERIKAAVSLGALAPSGEKAKYAEAADQALQNLFQYFEGMKPGLWEDTRLANGEFVNLPVKSSSLYHIINAISEYARLRPQCED